jgi:hypothetical protein
MPTEAATTSEPSRPAGPPQSNNDLQFQPPAIEQEAPLDAPRYPELSPKPKDWRPAIYGLLAALLVILFFGGTGWLFFTHPESTAIIRDIVIIYLGLGTVFIILLLIALVVIAAYLALKVNDLIQLLQREIQVLDQEIKPMLENLLKTTNTVRGTADFISEHAVQPVIETASAISAAQAIIRTLLRRG